MGLCTGDGGLTSHTAIIARAIGLPAVVGLGQAWEEVCDQEPLIVDGGGGVVLASPDEAAEQEYGERLRTWRQAGDLARASAHGPAVTRDGRRVEVVANVGSVTAARAALDNGAEGVGLLRTEFLFLDRTSPPDEDEQYAAYRGIADVMGQLPVVVRTLDVGGDKPPAYMDLPPEMNPFLGWRGVRVSLANPDLLKAQLRAILRAGAGRNLKIMFPMVTTVEEAREARRLVQVCRQELVSEGAAVTDRTEVGIMVEVPSAAIMADLLAPEVDFFSLGTNDLTQYALAVDRGNARVAPLYDWLHPAVLRLVKMVIDGGHRAGKWVGMCGEMAGDRKAIPLLLGLGLDEFSANPAAIPAAKELMRKLDTSAMAALAQRALNVATAAEVHALVEQALDQAPDALTPLR
jgi:phosphoenolpyruvate-protein phosphotransferase